MNPHKIKWDLFIIFLAIYNCIFLPIQLALLPDIETDFPWVEHINLFIDAIFLLDIIAQFRTTEFQPNTGEEITD